MPVLYLKLLGQMECRLPSGTALNLTSQKSKLLLAYLALTPQNQHSRDALKNLLWSNRSEDQARNSLRQSLSSMKKAFAPELPELFQINRSSVLLNPDQIRVDALEFERLLEQPTMDNLSRAAELYRHELLEDISLPDLPCQDWLANERERLHRRAIQTLFDLTELQLAETSYRDAIESAERLVDLDPLLEPGWRLLMSAYHRNGNRNHALMAYKRCHDVLSRELAVEPEEATTALLVEIKSAGADLNPAAGKNSPAAAANSARNKIGFDNLMQGWYHAEKHTPEDTAVAIEYFYQCIEAEPHSADAHAALAAEYHVELFENWAADRAATLELARHHLDLGLQSDADNALVHAFMAEHLLFSRDFEGAMTHTDRALELDPKLPDSSSIKATVLAALGQIDAAVEYADLSLRLDPHHPYSGWNAGEIYRAAGEYELAIKTFRRIHAIPTSVIAEIAACLAGLGKYDEARNEMGRYLELARWQMPNFPESEERWYLLWSENHSTKADADFDRFFDLLCRAGLCSESAVRKPDAKPRQIPSIAVLPFKNLSGDPEQEYLSDGITHEIIATLSRVKNMRIVAHHSVLQYKEQTVSPSQISEQQDVRYILVGNLRTSGRQVRVNVELIDSQSEEICWVEQYESKLDDVFALQDDISKNITVAMQVRFAGGIRDRQRASGTENVKAWRHCLIATGLQDSYVRENILEARRLIAQALELDPGYGYAWVTMGWTYWQEIYCGWSENPEESLRQAEQAAQSALAADPGNPEAWSLSGLVHAIRQEPDPAVENCQKAVDLEPGNAEVHALLACAQCFAGDYARARASYEASRRLCPVCPAWYLMIGGIVDLFFGQVDEAIAKFEQGTEIEPESPLCWYYLIDALIEAGAAAEAQQLAEEVRGMDEYFCATGIIRMHNYDPAERNRFRRNLESVGLS